MKDSHGRLLPQNPDLPLDSALPASRHLALRATEDRS